ncbi:hypothetical protein CWE09_02160 [Aliidiomarina minuta]|uniref:YcxB-like protein domain-containing protein n=1 Tax=Aliidiomarina minuta TaxID=880057 RepID=A0A432W666_9GAMM|nr:YcxB family protein [Aliidiomarina minuta]RUO25560.1 hypothetical protein CWE09_02160 [Aliidiomarina minuta]
MKHSGDTISVTVEYQLAEYKRMVCDFMPLHLASMQKPPNRYLPWNWPIIERAFSAVFIPIMFKIKVATVGTCKFTFSEVGLTRESKVGVKFCGWDEVLSVNSLSGIYLIHLRSGGAMPVPYRVFSTEDRRAFEGILTRVGA